MTIRKKKRVQTKPQIGTLKWHDSDNFGDTTIFLAICLQQNIIQKFLERSLFYPELLYIILDIQVKRQN